VKARDGGILILLLLNVEMIIWKVLSFIGLHSNRVNFDQFKSGGLHEKHAVATWNLGTISAFA
jgi:hypothetical protein